MIAWFKMTEMHQTYGLRVSIRNWRNTKNIAVVLRFELRSDKLM